MELNVAYGVAELVVKVRCERIVPVQGGVADLFKKTSIIVTRFIEVAILALLRHLITFWGQMD